MGESSELRCEYAALGVRVRQLCEYISKSMHGQEKFKGRSRSWKLDLEIIRIQIKIYELMQRVHCTGRTVGQKSLFVSTYF